MLAHRGRPASLHEQMGLAREHLFGTVDRGLKAT